MRKIYLILFLLFLSFPDTVLLSQNKTRQTIADLEQRRFTAMTEQDLPFLEKVLADNLTYAHSNGLLENKAQHLENIRSGKIRYEVMELEQSKTFVYKKAAVNEGIVKVTGSYKGTPFSIRLGFTDVYVKQRRKWKLAAWRSVKLE